MALLSDLVDQVRVDLGEDTGTATGDSMLTNAMFITYYNRWSISHYKDIRKEAALGSFATASGTTDYALSSVSSSVGYIDNVYRLEGSLKIPLKRVHPDDNYLEYISISTANVVLNRYSLWGNGASISFPDGPTSAETVYVRYYVKPAAAVTASITSTSFDYDDVFIRPFLTFTRAQVMRRQDRGSMWQTEMQLSDLEFRRAKRERDLQALGGAEGLKWRL